MIRSRMALALLVVVSSAFTRGAIRSTDDACALVRKADIDAAFAPRVFGEGEKGRGDFAGTAKLASVSECTFTSRGASIRELMTVSVLIRRAPSDQAGMTVAMAKDGAMQLKATPVDVAGLGDAAYWVNLGSSTRPSIQLNILKGKRLWIILGASGSKLAPEAALASLTKLAKAMLGPKGLSPEPT